MNRLISALIDSDDCFNSRYYETIVKEYELMDTIEKHKVDRIFTALTGYGLGRIIEKYKSGVENAEK